MSGKTMLRCGTALTTCLLLVSVSAAQEFGEIADAFRRNLDALRGYSWTSKIEYRIDGALRSTEVYRMHLDSEGSAQRGEQLLFAHLGVAFEGLVLDVVRQLAHLRDRHVLELVKSMRHLNLSLWARPFGALP